MPVQLLAATECGPPAAVAVAAEALGAMMMPGVRWCPVLLERWSAAVTVRYSWRPCSAARLSRGRCWGGRPSRRACLCSGGRNSPRQRPKQAGPAPAPKLRCHSSGRERTRVGQGACSAGAALLVPQRQLRRALDMSCCRCCYRSRPRRAAHGSGCSPASDASSPVPRKAQRQWRWGLLTSCCIPPCCNCCSRRSCTSNWRSWLLS